MLNSAQKEQILLPSGESWIAGDYGYYWSFYRCRQVKLTAVDPKVNQIA
jgi:hypothetical protein